MGVCQLADVGECLLQVGQHPLPEGVVEFACVPVTA
jgi:hypothetical protein